MGEISADGSAVLVNLTTKGEYYSHHDAAVYDRATGSLDIVSDRYDGGFGNGFGIQAVALSRDGRYVAFSSHDTDLDEGGSEREQPYLVDRSTGERRALVTAPGYPRAVSADGTIVGLAALTDLDPADSVGSDSGTAAFSGDFTNGGTGAFTQLTPRFLDVYDRTRWQFATGAQQTVFVTTRSHDSTDTDTTEDVYLSRALSPVDRDGDGWLDAEDNCSEISNLQQEDLDADGRGDACDADDDNDAVDDSADNCDRIPNTDQADNDADGRGDSCDADDDNDGIADTEDNCHFEANPSQSDDDGDGLGDACDGTFDSTLGKANGGGFVIDDLGRKVSFSANARSKAGGLDGTCVVTVAHTKIRCVTVDGYFQATTGDRVVFIGTATQDGQETPYRIEMEDRGEPGEEDRFTISTDAGFSTGGIIAGGDVQVHE